MNNKLYINGRPVTLWQKIVATVVGIAILVGLFFLTAALLPFLLLFIAGVIGLAWWRTRHIRAMIREQQKMMNAAMEEAQRKQFGGDQAYGDGSQSQSKGSSASSNKHKGETIEGDFKEL